MLSKTEYTVSQKMKLDIGVYEMTYDKFCSKVGKKSLNTYVSQERRLNLVRERTKDGVQQEPTDPFIDLQYYGTVFDLKFEPKEGKSFSISVIDYIIFKILSSATDIGYDGYHTLALRNLLQYDIDEIFYAKIVRGKIGIEFLKEKTLFDNVKYQYIKYNRGERYIQDSESYKFSNKFIREHLRNLVPMLNAIHIKKKLKKTYILPYLIYLSAIEKVKLYIVYYPKEVINHFTIADETTLQKHLDIGCIVLCITPIFEELRKFIGLEEYENKANIINERDQVFDDIKESVKHLSNFTITLEAKNKKPTYGLIEFTETDLKKAKTLKNYTGKYGYVVPIQGSKEKKALEGKKKIKYKKDGKNTIQSLENKNSKL